MDEGRVYYVDSVVGEPPRDALVYAKRVLTSTTLINGPIRWSVFTPLRLAVYDRSTDVVQWLLEQGADPNYAPHGVPRPTDTACVLGRMEILSLLLKAGGRPSGAVPAGWQKSVVALLIAYGVPIASGGPKYARAAQMVKQRDACRRVAGLVVALSRHMGRDVAVLLGRAVWDSRLEWINENYFL